MDTVTPVNTEPELLDPQVPRGFFARARRFATRLPFVRDLVAMTWTLRDPDTPPHVRMIASAALIWFVVPTDAIPDMLAGIGFTDDAAVALAAVRAIGPWMKDEHRAAAEAWLTGGNRETGTREAADRQKGA